MTSHVGRLYALAITLLVFFVAWAAIAARPWASAKPDPRVQLIALRQQALKRETTLVNLVLRQRAAAAKQAQLAAAAKQTQRATAAKQAQLASAPAVSAPSVRVVTLPPLTITRTS